MKINKKILSIPPYISTSWDWVTALEMSGQSLVVSLITGKNIEVPHLNEAEIEAIFNTHASIIEEVHEDTFQVGFKTFDALGMPMKHDPTQANTPILPLEVLDKISMIANAFSTEENLGIEHPVENCNCVQCQISRAFIGGTTEEEIKPEELNFQQWEIEQSGEKVYIVSNKIDKKEKYNVFLGTPIGCTCGQQGCDHILAVLKS